jgi:hypothetical protein
VAAQAGLGDRPLGLEVEQLLRGDVHIRALARILIRRRHVQVEYRFRHRHQARVRHPGAVAAIGDLAQLVLAHLLDRGFIRRRIILDGNLRRHAAHRRRAAPVAGLDQQ